MYNTVYIGAQDGMIPAYPRIPNDVKNNYLRYELDYVLWLYNEEKNFGEEHFMSILEIKDYVLEWKLVM